ncbi:MAG: sel1 repeat family protein [Hyphomicrobiaceae bacterium]
MRVWTLQSSELKRLDIDANESEKPRQIESRIARRSIFRGGQTDATIDGASTKDNALDRRSCGLSERQDLFATLTCRTVGLAVAASLVLGMASQGAMAQVKFASKKGAFTQGYSAFKSGRYDIAVPALKFAAKRKVMRAKFYLAKIYSDNSGGYTDHARAYTMLREIVSSYAHVDPKDFRVAPFVSKALISIARYERDGIAALKLRPNTKRALQFFDHAASHFSDQDAQFELAKHYLAGDGVEARVPYALNWLARLSKRGHAGAQAFLANLYWDGRYTVGRDRVRALALITVAVENVPEEDRFWIEDLHQNIFCEASRETRQRVHQVVGGWRQRFGRTRAVSTRKNDLSELSRETRRMCANGDVVGDLDGSPVPETRGNLNGFSSAAITGTSVQPAVKPERSRRPVEIPRGRMTRMKRDAATRSNLNGFVGRRDDDERRSSSNPGAGTSSRNSIRLLNGFGSSGNSSFGYSSTPRR